MGLLMAGLVILGLSAPMACNADTCEYECIDALRVTFEPPLDLKSDRIEVTVDDKRTLRCDSVPKGYLCDSGLVPSQVILDGGVSGLRDIAIYDLPLPESLKVRVLRGDREIGEQTFQPTYRVYPSSHGPDCRSCRGDQLTMRVAQEVRDGG